MRSASDDDYISYCAIMELGCQRWICRTQKKRVSAEVNGGERGVVSDDGELRVSAEHGGQHPENGAVGLDESDGNGHGALEGGMRGSGRRRCLGERPFGIGDWRLAIGIEAGRGHGGQRTEGGAAWRRLPEAAVPQVVDLPAGVLEEDGRRRQTGTSARGGNRMSPIGRQELGEAGGGKGGVRETAFQVVVTRTGEAGRCLEDDDLVGFAGLMEGSLNQRRPR